MFFCDICRMRNGWDESACKSKGLCEVCGREDICNDTPIKFLEGRGKPIFEDLGKISSISMTLTTLDGDPLEGVKVTSDKFSGVSDKNGRVILK